MFEFAEEAFDEVAIAIEERTEGRDTFSVGHWLDACPCAARCQGISHGVAIVGTVGQQDAAFARAIEHIVGRSSVMGLSFGQLQPDR